ncbi:MAG TPA: inositol monophosphatase family protein [Candidatus Limnocylindrales bacterium]|nr:inositol monophosphatase family protein [Candidatus Limnocylindrales bacterium]
MSTLDERRGWAELALSICDEADAIALRHFRRDLQISSKPDRTLVTQADTAIERVARERILAAHPDHGLVGEEYGTERGDAPTRWYIDPIDGTHNFVRGVPLFGTLLAVEVDGELEVGVMSAPAMRSRWYAWRGGGAWALHRNESAEPRRLAVSSVAAIPDAQLLYGSGRDVVASGRVPGFERLLADAWRERGFGDFWGYALVAEGAAEAMIEVGLSPWDAAAPAVVVTEAGGRWTDVEGRQRIDSGSFVVTNAVLHDEVLARLRGGKEG